MIQQPWVRQSLRFHLICDFKFVVTFQKIETDMCKMLWQVCEERTVSRMYAFIWDKFQNMGECNSTCLTTSRTDPDIEEIPETVRNDR
jgi:hypothetical protein